MCICVWVCEQVRVVPMEAKTAHWVPWSLSDRQMWAADVGAEIELKSPAVAGSTFSLRATSSYFLSIFKCTQDTNSSYSRTKSLNAMSTL